MGKHEKKLIDTKKKLDKSRIFVIEFFECIHCGEKIRDFYYQ